MSNININLKKLQWRVKHNTDFSKEVDFLETLLIDNGVQVEQIPQFLAPKKKEVNDPFLMKNMKEAVELLHKYVELSQKGQQIKILVRVDPDVDGFTSGSVLIQFIQNIASNIEIEYILNFDKAHGLTYKDIENKRKNEFDLIIIPDASMTCANARQIKKNFSAEILVLDHHLIENEFLNKKTNEWITREEAKILYKEDKTALETDCYTNYCLAINCHDQHYPNPHLSGAGVVQKFIEAYLSTYEDKEELDSTLGEYFLDLVSLGLIADSMDLRNLESRYYALEGLKERNRHNELLNEFEIKFEEEMKFGRTITSIGWGIAPKINGTIRYGKDQEQIDLFRAMLGVQENIEYQPRRKSKYDPKPPIEIHTLQQTMARVAYNVKQRQDAEVRKFVKELQAEIEAKNLDKNSVLFVDGTKVLTKGTVTGLVANKLASEYFRPVVLLRDKSSTEYGGSCRGYDKGGISSIKDFLTDCGMTVMGHDNAAGIFLNKEDLPEVIKKCNEKLPLSELCTIHTVDWEIEAKKLKKSFVQEVAENYMVFGNTVPEPLFAITGLKINASQINGYGDNNTFIRFVYNGIVFTKKYCSLTDYDIMTMRDRNIIGVNKKDLKLNLICQFVLNSWEDKVNPEVKILYFDVEEDKNGSGVAKISKAKKQVLNDDDFDW